MTARRWTLTFAALLLGLMALWSIDAARQRANIQQTIERADSDVAAAKAAAERARDSAAQAIDAAKAAWNGLPGSS